MRAFQGTTIRFCDPRIEAWRSTWLDPLNGRARRFIGRSTGDSILLNRLDEDPQVHRPVVGADDVVARPNHYERDLCSGTVSTVSSWAFEKAIAPRAG